MPEERDPTQPPAEGSRLDPAQAVFLQQRLDSEQNLLLAILAGGVASLAGAGVWAGVTVVTGYQMGFMAIGVGLAVGWAVRMAGRGTAGVFGAVGATLSLLGCALGNLLTVTAVVAKNEGVPLLDALGQLDPALVRDLMVAFFDPMDLLFYGIAIYEGYRFSFRRLSSAEIDGMLSGGGAR